MQNNMENGPSDNQDDWTPVRELRESKLQSIFFQHGKFDTAL